MNIEIGINGWLFGAMVLNFVILYWILNKYATKPLTEALDARKSLINKLENADVQYEAMITKAKKESDDIIAKGVKHKDQLLLEAKALADQTKESIIESGRKEAEKITKNAEHKAKLLEEELAQNYAESVKSTTEIVVRKLVNSDVDIKAAYLDTLVSEATQ
ncbi:MAG: ATP synthase F0 subunit B [Candidatus Peribacteria bacterium]|nr:MAG: ATP synthase F0 subunit B [Candidatus Peribacteria bacterium]